MKKLCIHFARFGPYHLTRIASAADALPGWNVTGLEVAGDDATYAWDRSSATDSQFEKTTVFPHRIFEEIPAAEVAAGITATLDRLRPDAVAIAGWGTPDARACLTWCKRNGARAIVMSETREADGQRVWWKEWLKSRVIRRFDAALVGGRSHRDYLIKLGFPAKNIHFGYNIIDNGYFADAAAKVKAADSVQRRGSSVEEPSRILNPESSIPSLHSPFFLASARFIERKNLFRLIEAFAEYRGEVKLETGNLKAEAKSDERRAKNDPSGLRSQVSSVDQASTPPWNLVLLGDGELRGSLIAHAKSLGLNVIEAAPWEEEKAETGKLKAEREGNGVDPSGLSPQASNLNSEPSPLATRHSPPVGGTPTVFLPGFIQYPELPEYYARASVFVHPALEEPWGLVINEAMACGLPILSGNNVGAAEELVRKGQNGWLFNANSADSISSCLMQFASLPLEDQRQFGNSSRVILEEKCPVAAFGKGLATCLNVFR